MFKLAYKLKSMCLSSFTSKQVYIQAHYQVTEYIYSSSYTSKRVFVQAPIQVADFASLYRIQI